MPILPKAEPFLAVMRSLFGKDEACPNGESQCEQYNEKWGGRS